MNTLGGNPLDDTAFVSPDSEGARKRAEAGLKRRAENIREAQRRQAESDRPGPPGEPLPPAPVITNGDTDDTPNTVYLPVMRRGVRGGTRIPTGPADGLAIPEFLTRDEGPRRLTDEQAEAIRADMLARYNTDVEGRGQALTIRNQRVGAILERMSGEFKALLGNAFFVLLPLIVASEIIDRTRESIAPTIPPPENTDVVLEERAPHEENSDALANNPDSDLVQAAAEYESSVGRMFQADEISEAVEPADALLGPVDDETIPWTTDGSVAYELQSLEADGAYTNSHGVVVDVTQPNVYIRSDGQAVAFGYLDNKLWEDHLRELGFDPANVLLYANDGTLNELRMDANNEEKWEIISANNDPHALRDDFVAMETPSATIASVEEPTP